MRDEPGDDTARIQLAYQVLFSRPAAEEEVAIAAQIVNSTEGQAGWQDLAHILLCTNEFVYMD